MVFRGKGINEYGFFRGTFYSNSNSNFKSSTGQTCHVHRVVSSITRLGWVRVAECVSVSVYMRVCIRCPFNQLSESQQSAAYAGGLGRICAQRPTTV